MIALQPCAVLGQAGRQLTFALQVSPDVAQVIVAQERGYWREFGVDVKLIRFESGREAFQALLDGKADFAAMADFPAAIGIVNDRRFAIIGDMSRYGAQRVIASRRRVALGTLADLEGRKLGTTLGTSAEFATSVLFAEGGMLAQIVDLAPREIVPSLARGDVDAAVMFPSMYAHAKHALGDDYREIVIKGYASHFLLATRPEMLASRATEVVILLQGLKRADAAIRADGPAAQAAIVRAMGPSMELAALSEMWKDLHYDVTLNEDLVSILQREATWLVDKAAVPSRRTLLSRQRIRAYIDAAPLRLVAGESVSLGQ